MSGERFYTRDDALTYIKEKYGIPVARSRLEKDAMAGVGAFPAPAKVYGRTYLYTSDQLDAYAKTLITDLTEQARAMLPPPGPGRGHRAHPARRRASGAEAA